MNSWTGGRIHGVLPAFRETCDPPNSDTTGNGCTKHSALHLHRVIYYFFSIKESWGCDEPAFFCHALQRLKEFFNLSVFFLQIPISVFEFIQEQAFYEVTAQNVVFCVLVRLKVTKILVCISARTFSRLFHSWKSHLHCLLAGSTWFLAFCVLSSATRRANI